MQRFSDSRPERAVGRLLVALTTILMAAAPAAAQTGVAFEFSFSNPGARSLGFGGAFTGLADDATAAFANPSGLTQLLRPEVSIEVRYWSYSTPFTVNGRIVGQPTGIGIDTEPGIRHALSEEDLGGLSYLSFVYPKDRWSFAIYRHLLANFEFTNSTQGLFAEGTDYAGTARLFERRSTTDLEIITHGAAAGVRIGDRASLGIGLVYFDGALRQETEIAFWDEDTQESFFSEISFLPGRAVADSALTFDDSDWGFTLGFLWHLADSWRLGGVFRDGPTFALHNRITGGAASPIPGLPPGATSEASTTIDLPDVYGLGIAFRTREDRLTFGFEWQRVEYSSIFDSLRGSGDLPSAETLDDGDELRLGAEYVFLAPGALLSVRAGAWLDPDHQVRTALDDPIIQALLPQGDDEMHYAAGFGASFRSFQIDLGVDFSDRSDTLALSAIYNF